MENRLYKILILLALLIQVTKSTQCAVYNYFDLSTQACAACDIYCMNCNDSTHCNQCDQNFELLPVNT